MKIIQDRTWRESTTYSLFYEYKGEHGAGYSFNCDENGNIFLDKLHDVARTQSLPYCQNNPELFKKPRIVEYTNRWKEPRIGLCSCGCEIELERFTNTCDGCQADYSSSGELLAPREQWGEETGESVADILSVDCYRDEM